MLPARAFETSCDDGFVLLTCPTGQVQILIFRNGWTGWPSERARPAARLGASRLHDSFEPVPAKRLQVVERCVAWWRARRRQGSRVAFVECKGTAGRRNRACGNE